MSDTIALIAVVGWIVVTLIGAALFYLLWRKF